MSVIQLDTFKKFNNDAEIKIPGIETTWNVTFDDAYRVKSSMITLSLRHKKSKCHDKCQSLSHNNCKPDSVQSPKHRQHNNCHYLATSFTCKVVVTFITIFTYYSIVMSCICSVIFNKFTAIITYYIIIRLAIITYNLGIYWRWRCSRYWRCV